MVITTEIENNNYKEVDKFLGTLSAGNIKEDVYSLWTFYSRNDNASVEMTKVFIKHKVPMFGSKKVPLLALLIMYNHDNKNIIDIIKLMIKADKKIVFETGNSIEHPLSNAEFPRDLKIAKLLIDNGVDATSKDKEGKILINRSPDLKKWYYSKSIGKYADLLGDT